MLTTAHRTLLQTVRESVKSAARCHCSPVAGPSSLPSKAILSRRGLHHTSLKLRAADASTANAASQAASESADGLGLWQTTTAKAGKRKATEANSIVENTRSAPPATSNQSTVPDLPVSAQAMPGSLSFSFEHPKQHPIRHGHHVCTLRLSSYRQHLGNLRFYTQFCIHAAYAFGLPCTLAIPLPVKTSLRTVPRGAFVHKPAQQNFTKKEHARYFKIYDADVDVVGQWLDYVAENGMGGVSIKATFTERRPLGFGQKMAAEAKDAELTEEGKVKELAESLLRSGFAEQAGESSGEGKQRSKPSQ